MSLIGESAALVGALAALIRAISSAGILLNRRNRQ